MLDFSNFHYFHCPFWTEKKYHSPADALSFMNILHYLNNLCSASYLFCLKIIKHISENTRILHPFYDGSKYLPVQTVHFSVQPFNFTCVPFLTCGTIYVNWSNLVTFATLSGDKFDHYKIQKRYSFHRSSK